MGRSEFNMTFSFQRSSIYQVLPANRIGLHISLFGCGSSCSLEPALWDPPLSTMFLLFPERRIDFILHCVDFTLDTCNLLVLLNSYTLFLGIFSRFKIFVVEHPDTANGRIFHKHHMMIIIRN